jgi:hypothetical protein
LFIDKEMGMLNSKDRLVRGSRLVVRMALVVNRLFFVAEAGSAAVGLRLLMVLGMAGAVGTEMVLRELARIIASAGEGDPFIAVNARRLQTIGWALLGLQLLDVPGMLVGKYFPSLGPAAPDVSFSPGGWIAVLMVFVLSRVFAAGSALKDELEGTV